jgi:CTP synthase
VLTKLKLSHKNEPDLENWKEFLGRLKNPTSEVKIGLVGKYVELPDAYKSIVESFIHAGAKNECKVKVDYIHSEQLTTENAVERLKGLHGVLVAPGFGKRGFEGKIEAIRYVRENNIPFFGICLGMQCAVVEYGRNVLGLKDANSTEMNPDTTHPVISMMEEQKKIINKGGTMRLGAYPCDLKRGTKAEKIYGKTHISERHRHRYEFNNDYLKQYESAGLTPSGINPENDLVEIVELKNHPFFVGSQFHPELKSTVANPHPLFINFVAASLAYARKN